MVVAAVTGVALEAPALMSFLYLLLVSFCCMQLSDLRDLRSCSCQYCTASLVVPLVLFCYSLLSDFFLACFSPCMFSTEYNTWYKFSTQESNMSPVALRDPICSSSAYQNTINSRIIVVL